MRPWPLYRKILAYVLFSALALLSIWIVDGKAHRISAPGSSPVTSPAQ